MSNLYITPAWMQGFIYGLLQQNWRPGFSQMTILDLYQSNDNAPAELVLETIMGRRLMIRIFEIDGAKEANDGND